MNGMPPAVGTFSAHLHTVFGTVTSTGTQVELELIDVSAQRAAPGREAFSLTFRGPIDNFLGQGTVALSHPVLGGFDLFLVPVARTTDGFLYEAIFNS